MIVTVAQYYHWKGTNKTAVRWLLIWCHLVCFWLVWLTPFHCPVHSTVQIRREAKLRSPRKQFMLLFSFQQGNALYSRHSTVETALIFSFLNVIWRHWLRLRFIASLCISLQVHFVTQIRHKRLSDVHFTKFTEQDSRTGNDIQKHFLTFTQVGVGG